MLCSDDQAVHVQTEPHAGDHELRTTSCELPWLAWAGWQMRIRAHWRPLKIDGGPDRGEMMLGAADHATARIRWWRPKPRTFEGVAASQPRREGPEHESFGQFTDLRLQAAGEMEARQKCFWYGYARRADLVLEVVINEAADEQDKEAMRSVSLPSLTAADRGGPMKWAVYSVSFVSPPGFRLTHRRLEAGHVALKFAGDARCGLVLRQIYPAGLALGKKCLDRWLRIRSFAERREYWPIGEPIDWSVDSCGRRLSGKVQAAWKRFGRPFHPLGRRAVLSAVVIDEQLDRLLMAECDAPRDPDERLLEETIGRMNWALWETGELA